jgi:plastocyanin
LTLLKLLPVAALAFAAAGPDRVAFPTNYKDGVLYTVADRHDIKQYRELYTSREAVDAAKAGKPLPAGTVITLVQYRAQVDSQGNPLKDARGRFLRGDLVGYAVMEKRAGWGDAYPDSLRNGDWEFAAFTADGKLNDKANYSACFVCHKPHAGQDYVISYPALAGRVAPAMAAAPSGSTPVAIAGFAFGPGTVTVAPGAAVTWTNNDESPHQITVPSAKLKTELVLKGQSASLTLGEAGSFPYSCALHPNMKGMIEVKR